MCFSMHVTLHVGVAIHIYSYSVYMYIGMCLYMITYVCTSKQYAPVEYKYLLVLIIVLSMYILV